MKPPASPDGLGAAEPDRPPDLVATFIERVRSVGGEVVRTGLEGVVETVSTLVVDDGPVAVTPELGWLAAALREAGVEARVATRAAVAGDGGEGTLEDVLRAAGAGVTAGMAAVAASGSVAVGPGGANGGLLMALPPHHVIVLPASRIVGTLAEALAAVSSRFDDLGGELVFVTGPSRTADIEMMSVMGVHGPLRLDVVVVDDDTESSPAVVRDETAPPAAAGGAGAPPGGRADP